VATRRRALSPGQWIAVAVLSLSAVAAFGLAPDTTLETVPTQTVVRALALPAFEEAVGITPAYWREERVQRGDTIGSLLSRAGVDDNIAMQFLRTHPEARPLYQLQLGRPVRVATAEDGGLIALRFRTGAGDMLSIERRADGFEASRIAAVEDVRTTLRTGEIRTSLFGAADAADVPDAITLALVEIFSGDIDFHHDLHRGDRFTVLYETRYVDGELVGTGRILAAEFENRGVTRRALLWRDPDGQETYFDENGKNIRTAFLRSPVEFSRITSGFTLARFHPILQQWRAHQGVDYAAPTGTAVRATADGIVSFAGVQNGYGNVIFVRHQGNFSTVYGHLSRVAPSVTEGTRVQQGETIGYVGMTGWATGPHLHYEFRVADKPRDPLTVAMPTAPAVSPERRNAFRAEVIPVINTLALAHTLPGAALAATR
jgi:murein DD-endopeptidase MepM/ murein hydrolase activator NlpD